MRTKAEIDLIEECYGRSISLLRDNSLEHGIIACAKSVKAVDRHYASIFGRDAAICAFGMVACGESELVSIAKRSLLTLARYQAPNGQIPKYVKPDSQEVDFWYYGCIDATLWWLVAVRFFDQMVAGSHLERDLDTEIRLAVHWLLCQEHQGLFLLQQNEASDWADIMPRSGFVLYSNALWYFVKRLYDIPGAQKTAYYFRHIFNPFCRPLPDNRRARVLTHYVKRQKELEYFLSFVNFSFWGSEIDVFGNILAMLFGLSSFSRSSRLVDSFFQLRVNYPYPVKVVSSPIRKNSRLWRPYMERHLQNFPYQYHNGGIWPFVGGFWVLLLVRLGRKQIAREELARFAEANRLNGWDFNEWLHGRTGKPMGMGGQSWNAAMFLLAYHALRDGVSI